MENANKEDAIVVAVTRDRQDLPGGDQVSLPIWAAASRRRWTAKKNPGDDKTVYLRADNRANYGNVMDTIDAVRTAGVSELGLITEKIDDSK